MQPALVRGPHIINSGGECVTLLGCGGCSSQAMKPGQAGSQGPDADSRKPETCGQDFLSSCTEWYSYRYSSPALNSTSFTERFVQVPALMESHFVQLE